MGRLVGALLILISVVMAAFYGYLLFFSDVSILVLKLTVFVGVLLLLGILGWIGYILIRSERVKVNEVVRKLEGEEEG